MPNQHLQSCQAYHSAVQRLAEQESDEPEENDSDPEEEEHFCRLFIDPQPHEFHAYLKWDCADLENPLRSYFGLRSLQGGHDFEDHGRLRTAIELDGNEWAVEFSLKKSGIAPRDSPNFSLEKVREYLIYVYPSAYSSWDDAKSEARKRAYFKISPRWPDIETKGEYKPMSNPCGVEGYDVEIEGSNWDFEKYPEILQSALQGLSERQGFRFNSPTPIHATDFNPDSIHSSSNIVDGEMYVRVKKGETGQVTLSRRPGGLREITP